MSHTDMRTDVFGLLSTNKVNVTFRPCQPYSIVTLKETKPTFKRIFVPHCL